MRGDLNGAWVLAGDGGGERRLGERNPVIQAEEARFAVADRLSDLAEGADLRVGLSALVCLFPELPLGSDLPEETCQAWVGDYGRLLELLDKGAKRPIGLAAWRQFADVQGLSRPETSPSSPKTRWFRPA